MADADRWRQARKAWGRLQGWDHDDPSRSTDRGADVGALEALADIGWLRHLLDQAELVSVKTARRQGKSWAEIATRLGVTRQSAWERWRELDDAGGDAPLADRVESPTTSPEAAVAVAAPELARRRRSSVVVPNVVGMSWDEARTVLRDLGLVAVGPHPDGPPLAALGWPNGVVTDQSPESGAKVPPGSPVTLWVERGGGSGVREPRRPRPDPLVGREMRSEPSGEAIG